MKCEIELLAVGEGLKAGDAIVIRYGDVNAYHLMLIDGGHGETGEKIVAHLKKYFGPDPVLEHVVLTHSDADHASGLRTVLQEIKVNNLWLHVPWLLAEEARDLFKDKRWTQDGLHQKIKAEYDIVSEIFELAQEADCKMFYPFAGFDIGPFKILSPSREAYRYLLPQFDKTPEPDQGSIEKANMWLGKDTLTPVSDCPGSSSAPRQDVARSRARSPHRGEAAISVAIVACSVPASPASRSPRRPSTGQECRSC